MTPEQIKNREAWIAALESGEYKQGHMRLATMRPDGVAYCCLGVGCNVLNVPEICEDDGSIGFYREYKLLPKEAVDLLGLRTNSGSFDLTDDIRAFLTNTPERKEWMRRRSGRGIG